MAGTFSQIREKIIQKIQLSVFFIFCPFFNYHLIKTAPKQAKFELFTLEGTNILGNLEKNGNYGQSGKFLRNSAIKTKLLKTLFH